MVPGLDSHLGLVDSEALCTDPWGILQIIQLLCSQDSKSYPTASGLFFSVFFFLSFSFSGAGGGLGGTQKEPHNTC